MKAYRKTWSTGKYLHEKRQHIGIDTRHFSIGIEIETAFHIFLLRRLPNGDLEPAFPYTGLCSFLQKLTDFMGCATLATRRKRKH